MLVYTAKKHQFLKDVESNQIQKIILSEVKRKLLHGVSEREIESWRNSLRCLYIVLNDDEIPGDSGVSIEYRIPLTAKRVDFILSGRDGEARETAVIIELKQWSKLEKTDKDGIVKTWLGRAETETSHPSYQAWTYAALIQDYNQTVQDDQIQLLPCAYLHNLDSAKAINDPCYQAHTDRAPVFISSDAARLSAFLKKYIRHGDASDIMYRIDHGRIRPSKSLADTLASMLDGNEEFRMIDDQKLVYETAIDLSYKAKDGNKQVLVVDGGPGTGKSVVAINLLVELTKRGLVAQYVTKNAAPRDVYQVKLTGRITRTRFSNLFRNSGAFVDTAQNTFDVLIVDEAHRLNAKSGLYGNLGENQIKELIHASKLCIFFVDEDQRVTFRDIGSKAEILAWANSLGISHPISVHTLALESQFRCNGSDGYLAWLDNTLQIRPTANETLQADEYEFRIFDSPVDLRNAIFEKNLANNKSRMVAGYCWDWKSKTDPNAMDIVIEGTGFEAKWNLSNSGTPWIIGKDSVREVGCIHTCQGLELDYVGVIIGPDLIVRSGQLETDGFKRSTMDQSLKGFKSLFKSSPAEAAQKADTIIRNTYRTLMSRGLKGCFIYCTDKETSDYFRSAASAVSEEPSLEERYPGLHLKIVARNETPRPANVVPVYDLSIAAGDFSHYQSVEEFDYVELPEPFTAKPTLCRTGNGRVDESTHPERFLVSVQARPRRHARGKDRSGSASRHSGCGEWGAVYDQAVSK